MTLNVMAIRDKIPEMKEALGDLGNMYTIETAADDDAFIAALYTTLGNLWEIVNDNKIKDFSHSITVLAEIREIVDVLDAKFNREISVCQLELRKAFGGYDSAMTLASETVTKEE